MSIYPLTYIHTFLFACFKKGIELEIVNSCEKNNGGCSHHCEHTVGGPHCFCDQGYHLDLDEKTCIGNVWWSFI